MEKKTAKVRTFHTRTDRNNGNTLYSDMRKWTTLLPLHGAGKSNFCSDLHKIQIFENFGRYCVSKWNTRPIYRINFL